jgi:hypothetical protein
MPFISFFSIGGNRQSSKADIQANLGRTFFNSPGIKVPIHPQSSLYFFHVTKTGNLSSKNLCSSKSEGISLDIREKKHIEHTTNPISILIIKKRNLC